MDDPHRDKRRRLVEAVLAEGPEVPSLRRVLAGREPGEVPEVLAAYVEKVRLHAYRVTDADVAALRAAGWSEDALFEVTVATSLGAAEKRLDIGLRCIADAVRERDAS